MNLHDDLTARMAPDAADIEFALWVREEERAEMALTPIMFPGKEYGIWTADTEVETFGGGFAIAANNDDTYGVARNEAALEAAKAMGERPGTVGYVVHRVVNGEPGWAVFEEILSPIDILKSAEAAR